MSKKHFCLGLFLLLAAAASLQAQYTTLHHFLGGVTDGEKPEGSLIRNGATLYGMTSYGGASNVGTIFKIKVDGTGFALLHSFIGGAADGKWPLGSLTFSKGQLYGMTYAGGSSNFGVIFRINMDGTSFILLHSFVGGAADGKYPFGTLTFHGGKFYGVAYSGGTGNRGVVFVIKPDGTGFTQLHAFADDGADGSGPRGTLVFSGNMLYGMTNGGGSNFAGTIFQISPNGMGFKLLHSFVGGASDGAYPWYGALVAKGSALYGLTQYGGTADRGVVFRIKKNGAGFAVLHSFLGGADGYYPYGSLISVGAKLYGLTTGGGTTSDGTIFQINPNGTGYTILHMLDDPSVEGDLPMGNLIKNGKILYGMTYRGGSADRGVIFSYKIK